MYQTIFFDLDGTLIDSSDGILNAVVYALAKFDITVEHKADLQFFIGPPLKESFSTHFNFSEEETQTAITYYREYYAAKGVYENRLYPHVVEILSKLKSSNKQVLLATSKPEFFAKQILENLELKDFFDGIFGATMDNSRSLKEDVISYALQTMNIKNPASCLMVGDRKHDIIGAKAHSIDSVGVLHGFGSKTELTTAGATYVINDLSELFSCLDTSIS